MLFFFYVIFPFKISMHFWKMENAKKKDNQKVLYDVRLKIFHSQ